MEIKSITFNCPTCEDKLWIFTKDEQGQIWGRRCKCEEERLNRVAQANQGLSEKTEQKTFRNFVISGKHPDIRAAKFGCEKYCENFAELTNQRHNWVALLGQPGSGKTHLLIAIANDLRGRGQRPQYWQYVEEMQKLKGCISRSEELEPYIVKAKKAPVLLIDDLFKGRQHPSDFELNTLFEILNYRYLNQLPTVISSERSIEALIDIDEALGSRIYENSKDYLFTLPQQAGNHRLEG